jgi:hypothetical protein
LYQQCNGLANENHISRLCLNAVQNSNRRSRSSIRMPWRRCRQTPACGHCCIAAQPWISPSQIVWPGATFLLTNILRSSTVIYELILHYENAQKGIIVD